MKGTGPYTRQLSRWLAEGFEPDFIDADRTTSEIVQTFLRHHNWLGTLPLLKGTEPEQSFSILSRACAQSLIAELLQTITAYVEDTYQISGLELWSGRCPEAPNEDTFLRWLQEEGTDVLTRIANPTISTVVDLAKFVTSVDASLESGEDDEDADTRIMESIYQLEERLEQHLLIPRTSYSMFQPYTPSRQSASFEFILPESPVFDGGNEQEENEPAFAELPKAVRCEAPYNPWRHREEWDHAEFQVSAPAA